MDQPFGGTILGWSALMLPHFAGFSHTFQHLDFLETGISSLMGKMQQLGKRFTFTVEFIVYYCRERPRANIPGTSGLGSDLMESMSNLVYFIFMTPLINDIPSSRGQNQEVYCPVLRLPGAWVQAMEVDV